MYLPYANILGKKLMNIFDLKKLFLLEPIGKVPPKFASILKTSGFDVQKHSSLSLQCPAQAFPIPAFR